MGRQFLVGITLAALLASALAAQTLMPIPTQATTYNASATRGYWFVAPTSRSLK